MSEGLSKAEIKKVINGKIKKEDLEPTAKSEFEKVEKIFNDFKDYLSKDEDSFEVISKNEFKKRIKENIKIDRYQDYIIGLFYDNEVNAKLSYSKKNRKIKIDKVSYEFDKLVKGCDLQIDEKDNIVLLNKYNANKIGEEIRKDNDYIPFAKILYDHYTNNNKNKKNFINNNKAMTEDPIFIVMREIDRDNSTNVWRYKRNRDGFKEIYKYIKDNKNSFFGDLSNEESTLPDKLTKISGAGINSFASKVCKYLCEYIYGKDGYFINDKFIRHALPFYLTHYKVKFPKINKIVNKKIKKVDIESSSDCDKLSYIDLYNSLNDLLNEANNKTKDKITKDELDRIIWYSYKSFK